MDDERLRQDIADELDFEPSIDATDIEVAVAGGIVTLTGHVRTCSEKVTAIDIVESIRGVREISNGIEVRPMGADVTADDEIARRILCTLQWSTSVPEDKIRVSVRNGWVTLEGKVEWRFQADAAASAVHRLCGVTGLSNRIVVIPSAKATDVTARIRKAFLRDAELDASAVRVQVEGSTVTLEGRVRYLGERKSAERAAWAAPGVTQVVDRLTVQ